MKNPLATQEMVRRKARRRRWWRRTWRTLLVVGAVVVVGGLAYGADRLAIEGHRLYVKYVEHGHGVTAPTSAPTTTATTVPGPPACASEQLDAYLDHWQIADSTLYEIIVVANASASPCSLLGYPGLGVSGQGGVAAPASVSDVATLGAATAASATAPVALEPGAQAWFELSYSVACSVVLVPSAEASGAGNQCYQGVDLQVTAPDSARALPVTQPLRFTYGTAGFQVGPFQAAPPPPSPPLG